MPSFVIASKCDGCKALDKTACQYICPNDLMVLNSQIMKAYNRDPSMCWECYYAGDRSPRICRFRSPGCQRDSHAKHRGHPVDRAIPQP
jgi:adenosine phosphosulfate reductase beta subunit